MDRSPDRGSDFAPYAHAAHRSITDWLEVLCIVKIMFNPGRSQRLSRDLARKPEAGAVNTLASFCRERQNSTLESWFLAFFDCRFCLQSWCAM